MYDKSISIMDFSRLTGINQDTIHDWGNNINKLSTSGCEIYKKLSAEREEAWTAKLESMKHPTAIAILLNKHYGYNRTIITAECMETLPFAYAHSTSVGTYGSHNRLPCQI